MNPLESSSLEQLLCSKGRFQTSTTSPGYAANDTTRPVMLLLQLLSVRSLFVLRLVSKTTKAWAEFCQPCLLSSLNVSFPPYSIPPESQRALNGLAQNVWQLKVMIRVSAPSGEQPPSTIVALPSLPSLTQLKIVCCTEEQYQPLLNFRRSLHAPNLPRLESLVIENISIQGILALRWGSFCSISSEGCKDASIWKGISKLSMDVVPWWTEPKPSQDGGESSNSTSHAHLSTEEKAGFKILHDWLSSFSSNTLECLRFAWVGQEGPNPLLLDQFAAASGRTKPWLSAPGIQWKHLTEVRFNGVEIYDEEVPEIRERAKGLKRLWIETTWTEADIEKGLVSADREEWAIDILESEEVDEGIDISDLLEGISFASIYGSPPVMGKLSSVEKTVSKTNNDRSAGSQGESFVTDWSGTYKDPFTSA